MASGYWDIVRVLLLISRLRRLVLLLLLLLLLLLRWWWIVARRYILLLLVLNLLNLTRKLIIQWNLFLLPLYQSVQLSTRPYRQSHILEVVCRQVLNI